MSQPWQGIGSWIDEAIAGCVYHHRNWKEAEEQVRDPVWDESVEMEKQFVLSPPSTQDWLNLKHRDDCHEIGQLIIESNGTPDLMELYTRYF